MKKQRTLQIIKFNYLILLQHFHLHYRYILLIFGTEFDTKNSLSNIIIGSSYVGQLPVRNLYPISQTFGNYTSVRVNGEWGIIKNIPVRARYNLIHYDQTVLGMDY